MNKPTKEEYLSLKEFKLRVQLEIHNAQMLMKQDPDLLFTRLNPYVVNIMGAEFKLYPANVYWLDKELKKSVNKFTTSRW